MEENRKVPQHLAIILDGNGRWAKAKGLPRTAGHVQGAKIMEDICEMVYNKGINYLTVYAFSTENWNRPAEEVEIIIGLLRNYLKTYQKKANKNNVKVRIIGDKSKMDEDFQNRIAEVEESTKNNTGLHFQVAINYGGRDEIRRAVNKLVEEKAEAASRGETFAEITEKQIADALDTTGLPDPDLLIRTSGDQRISNFLLWQLAYTEFYFTPVPWPDFNEEELDRAIDAYNHRERRFGGLK